jgi:glycosyltransferase involved in cell wall biosynthesis
MTLANAGRMPNICANVTELTLETSPPARVPTDNSTRVPSPRILYVIGGEQIGGSEQHLLRLLPYLGGFQLAVCCMNAGPAFFDGLRSTGVKVFDLGIPDLLTLSRLLKLKDFFGVIRDFRPDIIHSYGYTNDVLVPLFSRAAGRAHVVGSRRGQDFRKQHQLLRSLTNPLCDRVVCVSEATAEFVRRTERIDGAKVRVIQNGIVPGNHLCRSREPRSPIRFGTLGRVARVKGTDLLVDAFLNFNPDAAVELHVAGRIGSAWAEQLVSKVAASPHADKVKFVGFEKDPGPFLAELDVFVLPSRSEGMSNALLEAMGCGLPCIATDVGSNAMLLRGNGAAGLVCNPNPTDLYECMAKLREDKLLRAELGSLARRIVETEYSMEKMVESYRRLYLELLAN